jgi:hypothetical protein
LYSLKGERTPIFPGHSSSSAPGESQQAGLRLEKEDPVSVVVAVSELIDLPVSEVFRFHAVDHVRNHPRWDRYMQLEQTSDGPMGVGTTIKRINSRSGTPVEGSMEVVEFETDRAVAMVIHDGPVETFARASYEAEGDNRTRLTIQVEVPGMDKSMESMISSAIKKSLQNIKQMMESEFKE